MDGSTIALLGFLALLVLLVIRVPVGLAMLLVGGAGIATIRPGAVVPVLAGRYSRCPRGIPSPSFHCSF